MSKLDIDKLTVEFREGVSERAPLIPRRYTFTDAKNIQNMFLTIGPDFVYDNISSERNDVLGEWLYVEDRFRFYVYLHMDGKSGLETDYYDRRIRDLLLALEAIRYGDNRFFDSSPDLDQYPIIVYFLYVNSDNNKAENWGSFSDYEFTLSNDYVVANSMIEYRALIDEKIGDVNGDGIPDRVSIYGDKMPDSDFIHSIIIEVEGGQPG